MSEKSSITADWSKLVDDAPDAVSNFLYRAVQCIDKQLGNGYAKQHPELVGSFIEAAAIEEHGCIIGKCILELRDSLDEHRVAIWDSAEHIAEHIS